MKFIPALVLAMTLAGCAVPHQQLPAQSGWTDEEIQRLRRSQEILVVQLDRLQDNLMMVEARMRDQQKMIDELRTSAMAQKVTGTGEKATTAEPGRTIEPVLASKPPLSPTEIYMQAFADFASGRFQQAILGFEAFLRHYADNDYAANAQYWLGECYYSMQQYAQAVEAFQKMISLYPQGAKTPDALLKMASAYSEMNQPGRAEDVLQRLQQRYPDSPAARKSQESR
jgi:tol-pal system protein YbgF